jgi:ABC-2 type transport system permease protein
MRAALLIAGKDLRQRIRDRSFLVFALVLPLALAFVFNLVLGGVTNRSEAFRYAVVDADHGPIAAVFVNELVPQLERGGVIDVRSEQSADQAVRLVESGEVTAAFILPAGFSADVTAGRAARMQVVGDVDAPLGTTIARSISKSYVASLRAVQVSVATAIASGTQQSLDLVAAASAVNAPLQLTDVPAARKELDTSTFFAAGMAMFFLFFAVQFGVASLLDERRDGTLARLLAAPVPRISILAGKLLTSLLVGVLSMTVLVVATSLLLGADWGNPVGVAVLVLAGVLAATGIMAVVAGLARTAEQAGNWQAVVGVTLGTLGGVFFPTAQVGGLLDIASWATPHRWFMQGLADLAGGGGVAVVLPAAGAMLLFAAVTGAVALLLLRRVARP